MTPVMDTTWTASQASLKPRSFSRSVSPASMHEKKTNLPCRFFAAGRCSAGSKCSFSHATVAHLADEDSDDYPDMSHITSSMDQLAFLDDEIVGDVNKSYPAFGFDFHTDASIFAPNASAQKVPFTARKSLLPSFLLDEATSEDEKFAKKEEGEQPVVFFNERPASAAPVLGSRLTAATPTPSPSPVPARFSYGDAIRQGASNQADSATLQGYSVTPAAFLEKHEEPNFDEFEEADLHVTVPMRASEELCAFSILGKCRYGNYCRNLHGLQCPRCLLYILHPTDMERNENHLFECLSKPESNTFSDLHQIKCGICKDPVLQKIDPRFGLLNCNHTFCLSCIRSWRASNFDANDDFSRSCPDCREVTYFIVPSSTWIEEPVEKQRVIDQYKKKMSVIQCKYHDNGRGNCPFGNSCFYEHRNDFSPSESSANFDAAKAAYRQTLNDQNERLAKKKYILLLHTWNTLVSTGVYRMWNQLTDYLKVPLNSLNRVFNPQTSRSIEERNQFEAFKVELAVAISTRSMDSSNLVSLGRRGFSSEFRFWAWAHVLNARELKDSDFEDAMNEVFGCANPSAVQAPSFGASIDLQSLELSEEQNVMLSRILYIIGHRYPHLDFIPLLPALAGILSTVYDSSMVLSCLDSFVKGGHGTDELKDWPFFPHNRRENLLFARIFDDLLLKFVPNIPRHVLKIQKEDPNFNPRWSRLLNEFFIGVLPNVFILRIFDSYAVEGYKVIIRYALAHISLQQHRIMRSRNAEEFYREVFDIFKVSTNEHDLYPFKLLQKTAYSFKFSRTVLLRFKNRHRKLSLEDFEEVDKAIIMQKVLPKLLNRPSSFVTDVEWSSIWSWIPSRFRILDLEMVFTSAEHGHRLGTLFDRAADSEPLLLMVETTDGNIFGAFLSRSLRNRSSRKFFGTGETFPFTLRPAPLHFPWQEAHENQQFIYADENFLAIGCSAGKFGIWIDRDLNQVVSSPCDTFRNNSFIEHESGWSDIYCIELYRFK